MKISHALACVTLVFGLGAALVPTAHAEDAMTKKDSMAKKDSMMKKDNMKKHKDSMMKGDAMQKEEAPAQ